jgi:hypothetical protein
MDGFGQGQSGDAPTRPDIRSVIVAPHTRGDDEECQGMALLVASRRIKQTRLSRCKSLLRPNS